MNSLHDWFDRMFMAPNAPAKVAGRSYLEAQNIPTSTDMAKRQLATLLGTVFGIPDAVDQVNARVNATGNALAHPVQTAESIVEAARANPAAATGTALGMVIPIGLPKLRFTAGAAVPGYARNLAEIARTANTATEFFNKIGEIERIPENIPTLPTGNARLLTSPFGRPGLGSVAPTIGSMVRESNPAVSAAIPYSVGSDVRVAQADLRFIHPRAMGAAVGEPTHSILLSTALPGSERWTTLMHELVHAIRARMETRDVGGATAPEQSFPQYFAHPEEWAARSGERGLTPFVSPNAALNKLQLTPGEFYDAANRATEAAPSIQFSRAGSRVPPILRGLPPEEHGPALFEQLASQPWNLPEDLVSRERTEWTPARPAKTDALMYRARAYRRAADNPSLRWTAPEPPLAAVYQKPGTQWPAGSWIWGGRNRGWQPAPPPIMP